MFEKFLEAYLTQYVGMEVPKEGGLLDHAIQVLKDVPSDQLLRAYRLYLHSTNEIQMPATTKPNTVFSPVAATVDVSSAPAPKLELLPTPEPVPEAPKLDAPKRGRPAKPKLTEEEKFMSAPTVPEPEPEPEPTPATDPTPGFDDDWGSGVDWTTDDFNTDETDWAKEAPVQNEGGGDDWDDEK